MKVLSTKRIRIYLVENDDADNTIVEVMQSLLGHSMPTRFVDLAERPLVCQACKTSTCNHCECVRDYIAQREAKYETDMKILEARGGIHKR